MTHRLVVNNDATRDSVWVLLHSYSIFDVNESQSERYPFIYYG